MNSRPEITAMLSLNPAAHLPEQRSENLLGQGSNFRLRHHECGAGGFIQAGKQYSVGIEKGDYCYEVKSSVEDFHSKNGHNFLETTIAT